MNINIAPAWLKILGKTSREFPSSSVHCERRELGTADPIRALAESIPI